MSQRADDARRRKNKFLIWTVITPIAWPFAAGVAGLISEYLLPIAGLAGLVAILWVSLKFIDARKISKLAAAAATDKTVETYCSVPDAAFEEITNLSALERSGFRFDGSAQTIERLSPSSVVLQVNGQYANFLFRIAATEIATPPKHQTLFPTRIPTYALNVPCENRRSLTPSELQELENHAKAFRLKVPVFQIILVLWFSAIGVAKIIEPRSSNDRIGGIALVLLFAGVWSALLFISTRRTKSIRKDIRAGIVFRLDDPSVMEFLPCSRLMWSEEGAPSPWRRIISRDVQSDGYH